MALISWVLRSACHVLGYPTPSSPMSEVTMDDVESMKKRTMLMKAPKKDTGSFRMPLHYPRYLKSDYEKMEEWKLDLLLDEYGLSFAGSVAEKRDFAMGAFLWPDQY